MGVRRSALSWTVSEAVIMLNDSTGQQGLGESQGRSHKRRPQLLNDDDGDAFTGLSDLKGQAAERR